MAIKFSRSRKIIAAVVVAAVAAGGIYAAFRVRSAGRSSAPKTAVTALKKTNLRESASTSGTVKSKTSRNVSTTLNFPVKEIRVSVGDRVKKGDVLAVLDTSSVQKDVESAEYSADLAEKSARLGLEKAKADYEYALNLYRNKKSPDVLNAQAAQDSARLELESAKRAYSASRSLFEAGKLSRTELDQAKLKADSAQAGFNKAASALSAAQSSAEQNLKALKYNLDLAQAKADDKSQRLLLEKQQQNLKDAVITSPADGTVTSAGAVVGVPASGVLFTVADVEHLIVEADVKELDIGQVRIGQTAEIKTDATGSEVFPGTVSEIAPAATAAPETAVQTQVSGSATFSVKMDLAGGASKLKPGMRARIGIIVQEKAAVYAVPYDAVLKRGDGSAYIMVAEKADGGYRAKEQAVTTGMENDISVEISGDGLSDGMLVVDNPENVAAGAPLSL